MRQNTGTTAICSVRQGVIAQIKEKKYVKLLEGYTVEILLVGIKYDKESKEHQCVIERCQ